MTSQKIIARLKSGNERFVSDALERKLQDKARREGLILAQEPYAVVLSCADCRVVPELIFDAGIGEIFVIRVAGNIASGTSIATMEYAVANLNPKVLVVMGHENCGAVIAAVEGDNDSSHNLNELLAHITPAVAACSKESSLESVIKKNAELAVFEIQNRSTIINTKISDGEITILSAYYNLDSGKVDFL